LAGVAEAQGAVGNDEVKTRETSYAGLRAGELLWTPERIVRTAAPIAALDLLRNTMLRGAATGRFATSNGGT
jgi:hypothetical protein